MSQVIINGKNIVSNGNVTISNGKIIIDGKDFTPESKEINIEIIGNIEKLDIDACEKISINGNVQNLKTMSGNIKHKTK